MTSMTSTKEFTTGWIDEPSALMIILQTGTGIHAAWKGNFKRAMKIKQHTSCSIHLLLVQQIEKEKEGRVRRRSNKTTKVRTNRERSEERREKEHRRMEIQR